MPKTDLPPGQHEIKEIMRWNVDHPGIMHRNPPFDPKEWELIVDGSVEKSVKLSWDDILSYPPETVVADFHCVEGWTVKDCKWTGVPFKEIIKLVKPEKGAKYVLFSCGDGFTASLELDDLEQKDSLLAYKYNDEFLQESLGSPIRLIVKDKYAYKNPMWILRITFSKKLELGYWEKRGYSNSANIWKNERFKK
jgi:DMSO/TMAO reductase YedYZ molybdopterin-dependent catalytic subunit